MTGICTKKRKLFMNLRKSVFISILILGFLSAAGFTLKAEDEFDYFKGARKGEVDTLALEASNRIIKETKGLLEKEIDPDKYVLGPGDILNLTYVGVEPETEDIPISPEGILMIPSVGAVNLKGKTLSEAKELVREKVGKVINTSEIDLTLADLRRFKVTVNGAVRKQAIVAATAADRVSEVIEKAGGMKLEASLRNIILLRSSSNQRIKVDLVSYFRAGIEDDNPTVLGGDIIIVPQEDEDRSIEIFGEVSMPEEFEYVDGDSLSLLIKFGMGLTNEAVLDSVEIARFDRSGTIHSFYVDISQWENIYENKNLPGDIPLLAGDRVFIRKKSESEEKQTICIMGEVIFPGYYAVKKNQEKISDVLRRSGGFTNDASPEAAILIRQKESKVEDPEMERLHRIPSSEMSEDELKFYRAKILEKKGVMAIDFRNVIREPGCQDDIVLEDMDSIYVPQKKIFVNVQGRVNNPGLIPFNPKFSYIDYISMAGGYGYRADEGETMIVKSKGRQFDAETGDYVIEPGDYILVPPESDFSAWTVFTDVMTVMMQLTGILGVVIALVK